MKIIIALLILTTMFSCSFDSVQGSSKIIKKKYDLKNFNSIDVSNSFDVEFVQSDTYKVTLDCNENILEYVDLKVDENKLVAKLEGNHSFTNTTLKLKIHLPELEEVQSSGACEIKFKEFHSDNLLIELSGASEVKGQLFIKEKMIIDASGASEIKLNGKTKNLELDLSGASEFKGKNFIVANHFVLDASGASDIETTVNGTLDIEASGASEVDHYGKGKVINKDVSGAGSITSN